MQLIFWSNHLNVQFERLLPPHLAQTLTIHYAGSYEQVTELLAIEPDINMVLTSIRPADIEALYQVQQLQRSRPELALVALFDTTTEVRALTRGLELLLGRLDRDQSGPASAANPGNAVSLKERRRSSRAEEDPTCRLTVRQKDVLQLIIEGKSNKQIARELDLCEGTVKIHCMAIFRELEVTNRTQAAIRGEQLMNDLMATA